MTLRGGRLFVENLLAVSVNVLMEEICTCNVNVDIYIYLSMLKCVI